MDKRKQNGRLVDPMDIDRQLTLSEIKQLLEIICLTLTVTDILKNNIRSNY